MRRFFLLLFLSTLFFPSCESRYPPGFIVLPGAEGVKTFYVRGINKAIYLVHSEFPAEKVVAEISTRLEKDGWQPLEHLYLYPDVPSGKTQGWTFYEQAKRTGWMVYEWTADWRDKNNNIVSYALQYRDPIEKYRKGTFIMRPASDGLSVNFVYMPKEVAESLRETMKPKK